MNDYRIIYVYINIGYFFICLKFFILFNFNLVIFNGCLEILLL